MKTFGTGCSKSILDGTEKLYTTTYNGLPAVFNLIPIMPPILDQGPTSMCVAYSLTAYMDWKKNIKENDNNGSQFNLFTLYNSRKDKSVNGMQIKEALSYLRHTGLNNFKINGYAKVNSEIYLKSALMLQGPCPIALPVKSYKSEFWNGNNKIGYHCVLVVGFDETGFLIRNSWGTDWGKKGYTRITYDDFNKNLVEAWTIL